MSIPRWCGVGHCRSRGRVLAVGWVGREPLPHVPTSGLRVGGGAGGGAAAAAIAEASGDDGAEVAGGRRGRGPLTLREGASAPLLISVSANPPYHSTESFHMKANSLRLAPHVTNSLPDGWVWWFAPSGQGSDAARRR